MRVAVYGNLIYDQLITLETPLVPGNSHRCVVSHAAGGLANFIRAGHGHFDMSVVSSVGRDDYGKFLINEVSKYADIINISVTETPTTFASVIVDRVNCERTGMVQWNGLDRQASHMSVAKVHQWPQTSADWHHLMYLDRMSMSVDQLKQFTGTVSADMCTVDDLNLYLQFLPYIDYLIVSEQTRRMLADKSLPVRKGLIVHSPDSIYFKFGATQKSYRITKEKDLNVVGAGDYFAAFTIANLLVDEFPNLQWIHERTLQVIRRQS